MKNERYHFRKARAADISELARLIRFSVEVLQAEYYTKAQRQAALGPVFGVDQQLIRDGTYYIIEYEHDIVACGGWSRRKALYGGGIVDDSEDASALDPAHDAARIRAFFVHPAYARQGLGRALLRRCEQAILLAGFCRSELVATLPGEPLYAAGGYQSLERYEIALPNVPGLPVVRMTKTLVTSFSS